jgi:hypothetical protein
MSKKVGNSVVSSEKLVWLLRKSFVRCNSVGASSSDVAAADVSQEVTLEAMVRGG